MENWKINREELIQLLKPLDFENYTNWMELEDIDEDEFLVLKTNNHINIMDPTNRFLYFSVNIQPKPMVLKDISFYAIGEKTARAVGNGANVLVPKSWVGKRVKILLLESLDSD